MNNKKGIQDLAPVLKECREIKLAIGAILFLVIVELIMHVG